MSDQFSLPSSSYNELIKIIKGYSINAESATLGSLSQLIGMSRTTISSNSKFLSELGLIEGGKTKSSTSLGIRLGRALEHSQQSDISELWQETISGNEKLANLVTTVRIKGGMSEDQLLSHILYVSVQKATKDSRTGARTIVDILIKSGLLEQEDGQLQVATPTTEIQEETVDATVDPVNGEIADSPTERRTPSDKTSFLPSIPEIAINIQLHLPETENPDVYDNLFKSLKKHLLNPDE